MEREKGNNISELKELISIFEVYPEIKLVYLFGSRATSKYGPLSDYDFAIYFDHKDKNRIYEIKFELFDKISRLLKTDRIDVVVLNLIESPEMKYQIIKEGRLILEKEPFKVIVEPKILNEYFDFQKMLLRHKLTKATA
ncbi:MAG: nucleotidyltransferase domain-containing protein [Thermodesulfovibrionales bacterium]|nr:nucleotidyltransferase domain-containing protein [Thermodesulfovibrionales bacterium]